METMLAIAGLLIAIIGLLYPNIKSRFLEGPKLVVDLRWESGNTASPGLSSNNNYKSQILADEAIHVYQIEWRYKLTIRNNSSIAAYEPQLSYYPSSYHFFYLQELNPLLNIPANSEVTLEAKLGKTEECLPRNRTSPKPENFNEELKLLLEYKNPSGKKFYTTYSYSKAGFHNVFTKFKDYKPALINKLVLCSRK